MTSHFEKINLKRSDYDHSVYLAEGILIAIYVNDILVSGSQLRKITKIKEALKSEFEMVDSGPVKYFLGIEVHRTKGGYILSQKRYIQKLLEEFGFQNCTTVTTPIDKLHAPRTEETPSHANIKEYQRAIGALIYLMLGTRPDISFAVSHLAQFCSNPSSNHWTPVKRIFRYLKGTVNHALWLTPDRQGPLCDRVRYTTYEHDSGASVKGYSDSDWAGGHDRKSVGGYEFFVEGCLVSWASRKQAFVVTSTMKAEYVAAATATKKAIWLAKLLAEINYKANVGLATSELTAKQPITIYCDNQAAIRVSKNPEDHKRSKHIDISFHMLRQRTELGEIELEYINTNDMAADYLTKPLIPIKFIRCRNKSGIFNLEI